MCYLAGINSGQFRQRGREPELLTGTGTDYRHVTPTNDDLFYRLEAVCFFRLFTGEGDMKTRAEVMQNPEAYRLEYCPDCHLAQISLRRGAAEHVLHCDGSLEGLFITRV
jgi:hypothetical protein